jgi:hypothetical protein
MPTALKTVTASVLRGVTGPLVFVQDTLKLQFGEKAALNALAACGTSDSCIREAERHIPEAGLAGFNGTMALEGDGACRFEASLGSKQYYPTQLGLEFAGSERGVTEFADAVIDMSAPVAGHAPTFLVEGPACEFARQNETVVEDAPA